MQPQFPGMNPYLENPALWTEVHFGLIAVLVRSLNPKITPKYRAAVEKRVYADALLIGIPDVTAFQHGGESNLPEKNQSKAATETLPKPLTVSVPMLEEVQEPYLEIRDVGSGRVVTVVEVLSPKNKRAGEGRVQYDTKRQKILNSSTHLVEIDLLRSGEPQPIAGGISSDYRILVSRSPSRPAADLYAFHLRDEIPRFALPLQVNDVEPIVDLNWALAQVYEEAALDLAIDYTQQPVSPVSSADFEWIQELPFGDRV